MIEHTLTEQVDTTTSTHQGLLVIHSLTIAECGETAQQIRQLMNERGTVELGLEDCEDIDTCGLQLLCVIQSDPLTRHIVQWSNLHPNIVNLAKLTGLDDVVHPIQTSTIEGS